MNTISAHCIISIKYDVQRTFSSMITAYQVYKIIIFFWRERIIEKSMFHVSATLKLTSFSEFIHLKYSINRLILYCTYIVENRYIKPPCRKYKWYTRGILFFKSFAQVECKHACSRLYQGLEFVTHDAICAVKNKIEIVHYVIVHKIVFNFRCYEPHILWPQMYILIYKYTYKRQSNFMTSVKKDSGIEDISQQSKRYEIIFLRSVFVHSFKITYNNY